jgi:hypothetical protein
MNYDYLLFSDIILILIRIFIGDRTTGIGTEKGITL